jgi:transposase
MTVAPELETEIRRLFFAEHWKVGTIAGQLNVHHDVVRRVLGLLPARPPSTRGPRPQRLDPYREFIAQQLAQYPRLRSTRLYDMIHERGYAGGVRTLRRLIARIRPVPRAEVFLRLQLLPGEQSQIDWAHVGTIPVPGGERPLWVFLIVLAYSRALWAELVFELTADSLCRSLMRASAYFGGASRQWLFDNPKSVVLERHGDAARFHPELLELASHYHVQPRLCAVAKANQKGRVERAVRYLRERFFAGRRITDLAAGNRELARFLEQIALPRPHPVFKDRSVAEVLAEERPHLLPLPATPPATDRMLSVRADKTATVHFDTNLYSVPPAGAGKLLTLVASDTQVRVLEAAVELACHPRCWGRRQLIELAEHREAIVRLKRAAQELKGRDRLRTLVPSIDQLYGRWIEAGRSLRHMTAQTSKLLDLYGEEIFREAVAEILVRGLHDPGALAQWCEQKRRALTRPVPVELVLNHHVPDRDVIPHNLEDYDDHSQQ